MSPDEKEWGSSSFSSGPSTPSSSSSFCGGVGGSEMEEELIGTYKQPKSPQETASLCSRIFFVWLLPLFRKGYRSSLQVDDLYACPNWEESQPAGDRLQEEWEKELSTAKPSLFKALFRVYRKSFFLVSIFVVIEECVNNVLQPVMLGFVVRHLTNPKESNMSYTAFVFSAIAVSFFGGAHIFTQHPYFFNMQRIGMRVRVSCCSILYRKCLKLSHASLSKTAAGQLVNLMSNDVVRFDNAVVFIPYLVVGPLQTIIITIILYNELGWSSLCGVAFVILWIPFQAIVGRKFASIRLQTAELTDKRVRFTNELVAAMRVIKMYAWEKPFGKLVSDVRELEIGRVRIASTLKGVNMALFFISSKLVLFLCFTVFALVQGGSLTSERVFVSMALFNSLRLAMTLYFPFGMGQGAESLISIGRLQEFLELEERPTPPEPTIKSDDPLLLRVADLKASWEPPDLTLDNINFRVHRGELLIVVGGVGSGKTSLLMSILGELPLTAGSVKASGNMTYASQVPWLFNATLKRNIAFNSDFDERRFKRVVEVCALERDLTLLPLGENTLVEDKGVSLSGGQKARVGLARAVYHDADIYLLDDPLSAVDAAVAKHIFEKCIRGYLRHKAVVLCTHQLQFLRQADKILVLQGGRVSAYGRYQDIVNSGVDLGTIVESPAPAVITESRAVDNFTSSLRRRKSSATSMMVPEVAPESPILLREQRTEEIRSTGTVSGKVYWQYAKLGAGPVLMTLLIISSLVSQALFNGTDFWLTYWSGLVEKERALEQPENNGGVLPVSKIKYLATIYGALVVCLLVASLIRTLTYFIMCMRSSISLHNNMFTCITRSPMTFFDQNPIGRIQNRFTKDLGIVDDILPPTGLDITFIFLNLVGIQVVVAVVSPWILIPTILLCVMFVLLWRFYMRTGRDIKRLEGITRSPVYSHLSSSLYGLSTIRAYRVEGIFERIFDLHQDRHTSSWNLFLCSARWFGITLDFICFTYITVVTMTLSLLGAAGKGGFSGGEVGLAITNALMLTGMFQWGVRQTAEMESQMTAVERVIEYSKIEPEAKLESDEDKKPPKNWPQFGGIQLRDVSLSYKENNEPVLKGLNCEILPREKIGIVGRTGAGKSSIISALFRLNEPQGKIIIDGVSVTDIGLHDLRTKISIIPQESALFMGTVRKNLDPFLEKTDDELWKALDEAKLKETIKGMPGGLSAIINEEGSNLSVGERQLVCLARAIVRQNRILILDEATANVDPRTDQMIQATIRDSFALCTVLTVAHRLHTVMDSDRIMVLDAGEIQEFDSPHILLEDSESQLSKMVAHTGVTTAKELKVMAREAHKRKEKDISNSVTSL